MTSGAKLMAHAIWTGAINFGLVTIPVKLQTAVRPNELRFNFLHRKDEGRINNVRRCSVDGEEVAYGDLVRGYEYEKGRYVILEDEDFDKVNVEATQSVDIVQFVDLAEINPMYFDKPYYLEPEKRGRHAYALLREALKTTNKVGIAKVVIRSKEHLAALKPNGDALVLELMHYADEIVDQKTLELPDPMEPPESEMKMAQMLIDSMTEKFDPEKFHDVYREQLLEMIEARAAGKTLPEAPAAVPRPDNVVNLMDVLAKSLEESKRRREAAAAAGDASGEDEDERKHSKPKKTSRRKSSAA
jgi:DNA end-binding protein Ku